MAVGNSFGSPISLSGLAGTAAIDNTGATYEVGEPANDLGGDGLASVWYVWTLGLSAHGQGWDLSLDTDSSPAGWDSTIEVFTGSSLGALTLVASEDDIDYPTNPRTFLTCTVPDGTTVRVRIDGWTPAAETANGVLTYSATPVPPPAPTAGTWSSSGTTGTHVLYPGDDATVAGTNLDTVTTVTVGGVTQPFDITSPTVLVVHVTSSAVSGVINVANAGGDDDATGSATVLYPGPWVQPADDVASEPNYAKAIYGTDSSDAPIAASQPDITGEPKRNDFGYTEITVHNRAFPDVDVLELEWGVSGAVILAQPDDPQFTMPHVPSAPLLAANPDAYDVEHESLGGIAVTDVEVGFSIDCLSTNEWVDDVDNKTASDLTGDLWQTEVQYRRLEEADWTSPDISHVQLASAGWPSQGTLAALDLDFASSLFLPGETLTILTEDDSGLGLRVDNHALHDQAVPDAQASSVVLTWAEYEVGVAWVCAFDRLIDAAPLNPPYVGPDAVFPLQRKLISAKAEVRLTWTYRPPRYRLIYDTPPAATAVHTLRRRQQAARGGMAPRRRQIAARAGSLRRGPGAAP